MSNIVFIIPYFGIFPNYFQLFLDSVAYNNTIDFLIFTDDYTQYSYPNNVSVEYCTFDDIRFRINAKYNNDYAIDAPHKLCDYKPAYGDIFSDYIQEYKYWGHCDVDLIFGDIRAFITDDLLLNYKKIGHLGHFCIYENSRYNNTMYLSTIVSPENTRVHPFHDAVAQFPQTTIGFDEWNWPWSEKIFFTINDIYKQRGISLYYENRFADIYPYSSDFVEVQYDPEYKKTSRKHVFCYHYEKGKLYSVSLSKKIKEEKLYIHLQKRNMIIHNSNNIFDFDDFYIFPDKFCHNINTSDYFLYLKLFFLNKKQYEYSIRRAIGKTVLALRRIHLWK